jgi:hypothetical protein
MTAGFEVLTMVTMKSSSKSTRAIAQAVIRRLPTAAVRPDPIQAQVIWGLLWTRFSPILRFPLIILIPATSPKSLSSSSSEADTIDQLVADVLSGTLVFTPAQE